MLYKATRCSKHLQYSIIAVYTNYYQLLPHHFIDYNIYCQKTRQKLSSMSVTTNLYQYEHNIWLIDDITYLWLSRCLAMNISKSTISSSTAHSARFPCYMKTYMHLNMVIINNIKSVVMLFNQKRHNIDYTAHLSISINKRK